MVFRKFKVPLKGSGKKRWIVLGIYGPNRSEILKLSFIQDKPGPRYSKLFGSRLDQVRSQILRPGPNRSARDQSILVRGSLNQAIIFSELFSGYYEINKLELGRLEIGDLECVEIIRTFSEVIMMFDVVREIESFRVKNVRMFRCSQKEIRKVYSSVLSLIIQKKASNIIINEA